MQVFVPYPEPIKVAQCLDPKRLNKQIIECQQIISAINSRAKGSKAGWSNHPVVRTYEYNLEWLENYWDCLIYYRDYNKSDDSVIMNRLLSYAIMYSKKAEHLTPSFLTEEFCDQHKRRLYTKNPEHYKQFAEYGKTEENWYFVDGELRKYINGKRIE